MGCTVAVFNNASRRRQAQAATSSAACRASSGLPLVIAWTVMPTSGTSAKGKPKKTFIYRSGSRASQVRARWTRSIHGEAPVHCSTVAVRIGTFAADGADQHARRALALQAAVVVREVFRAEREVGVTQELGVLVAMRIERTGDKRV